MDTSWAGRSIWLANLSPGFSPIVNQPGGMSIMTGPSASCQTRPGHQEGTVPLKKLGAGAIIIHSPKPVRENRETIRMSKFEFLFFRPWGWDGFEV
jgi:hypothetical protein